MEETLGEVVSSRSFDSLVKAVNAEKEKKAGLQQTILKYVLLKFRMHRVCLMRTILLLSVHLDSLLQ